MALSSNIEQPEQQQQQQVSMLLDERRKKYRVVNKKLSKEPKEKQDPIPEKKWSKEEMQAD